MEIQNGKMENKECRMEIAIAKFRTKYKELRLQDDAECRI
jgi:predicted HTH domain antitoxin